MYSSLNSKLYKVIKTHLLQFGDIPTIAWLLFFSKSVGFSTWSLIIMIYDCDFTKMTILGNNINDDTIEAIFAIFN